ncbi:MAG: ABC transporter substrate-binding protein [Chloroflexi bacterium]|nr:ABC transporter substrate-binding protein [Chloroflexota bacterium]
MPFWVASETGMWAKNGLNAESILVEGSPKTVAALVGGDIQFALVGSAASVLSSLGGADLALIATAAPGLSFRVYAKSDVKTSADLQGKGIAISTIGTDPDFALRLVLPKLNVNYADIKVVQFPTGGDPARLAGIQAGQADAAVLSPGSFGIAEQQFGLHPVIDMATMDIQYEQATIAVLRKWATSHPDEMAGFEKTFSQSIAYIQQNKAQTLPVLKKYLQTDSDTVAGEAYDGNNVLHVKGLPFVSEPGVQSVIDLLALSEPKAQGHKAAEFVENSYLQRLADSGFKP